mmetsp:Transcript_7727/g.26303  ORF Transcript_7727/g.26303 Transcript_7727/m.26303 type:complete len:341 (+) Transcript_7727:120-1142(+)
MARRRRLMPSRWACGRWRHVCQIYASCGVHVDSPLQALLCAQSPTAPAARHGTQDEQHRSHHDRGCSCLALPAPARPPLPPTPAASGLQACARTPRADRDLRRLCRRARVGLQGHEHELRPDLVRAVVVVVHEEQPRLPAGPAREEAGGLVVVHRHGERPARRGAGELPRGPGEDRGFLQGIIGREEAPGAAVRAELLAVCDVCRWAGEVHGVEADVVAGAGPVGALQGEEARGHGGVPRELHEAEGPPVRRGVHAVGGHGEQRPGGRLECHHPAHVRGVPGECRLVGGDHHLPAAQGDEGLKPAVVLHPGQHIGRDEYRGGDVLARGAVEGGHVQQGGG